MTICSLADAHGSANRTLFNKSYDEFVGRCQSELEMIRANRLAGCRNVLTPIGADKTT
jgi:hypothetical protein